ncbi:hypoxanthine phosphoribosyltransferase [Mesoplasma photuris]|uniref:hypoxanthine phosphoribosyltransferase n=1 Tax=Mesoplasma photuris TaxID=217731 RepID=UPI0004E136AB|nr:hypoxanthine phosphoribosyltransferase [Mesoplasma photuris]
MKHPLVKEIIFSREQIQERTKVLAEEISQYYKEQKTESLLCIGLLKGCIPFYAEFIANYNGNCETDYMVVSSYRGGIKTSGEPKILLDVNTPLKDRDVLIIEDIIDSGFTLEYIKHYFINRGAKSVKIVTLLDKKVGRKADIKPDWYGFDVDDEFIIGYGLDYQEKLRNLPYIATCDTDKLKDWKW